MALNTDFILRTGPYDQKGKTPIDDAEGEPSPALHLPFFPLLTLLRRTQLNLSLSPATRSSLRPPPNC